MWWLVPVVLVAAVAVGYPLGSWLSARPTSTETSSAPTSTPTADGAEDATGASPPTAPPPPPTTQPPPATTTAAALDPCVVGTWQTTEHTESFADPSVGTSTLTGLTRTVTFRPDGTETVTYPRGSAGSLAVPGGAADVTFEGEVHYAVTTRDGQMRFRLTGYEWDVQVSTGGVTYPVTSRPGSGPVSYSCDATTLVQQAPGFSSRMERLAD